ncbi:hypothetical protein LOC70_10200 [Rhodopirellula sp. JC737]|nr:hypothetical protein [Rhodopirellula sp. JC737]
MWFDASSHDVHPKSPSANALKCQVRHLVPVRVKEWGTHLVSCPCDNPPPKKALSSPWVSVENGVIDSIGIASQETDHPVDDFVTPTQRYPMAKLSSAE